MKNNSSGATWGIAGPTFLLWYILAAAASIAVPLALTIWTRSEGRHATGIRPLTAPEVGSLTSDYQSVIASLTILRTAGVLGPGGVRVRSLTAEEKPRIDWFTRVVLERLGSGTRRPDKARLITSLAPTFGQLRTPLIEMDLLTGDRARRSASIRCACVLTVAAVGIVRIAAGLAGGKPVLYLVLVVVVLLLAVPFVRRVPRRTPQGTAELRRLSSEHAHLAPRMRPAFTTYGPNNAGMSAALFGGAALLWLDPQMAGAMNTTGSVFTSFDSSSGGGFDSGSSGSDSGSSSSCGGGGGGCGG
nr:TIGR04222 domain-containing membrane protein [Rhodococcus sp. (in: high G+C Gram-positive bacteria)]